MAVSPIPPTAVKTKGVTEAKSADRCYSILILSSFAELNSAVASIDGSVEVRFGKRVENTDVSEHILPSVAKSLNCCIRVSIVFPGSGLMMKAFP